MNSKKEPLFRVSVLDCLSYESSQVPLINLLGGVHLDISGIAIFLIPSSISTATNLPRIAGSGRSFLYRWSRVTHITSSVQPPTVLPDLLPPMYNFCLASLLWNVSCDA